MRTLSKTSTSLFTIHCGDSLFFDSRYPPTRGGGVSRHIYGIEDLDGFIKQPYPIICQSSDPPEFLLSQELRVEVLLGVRP